MYEYINGRVIELTPTSIVIEAGGIGYLMHLTLNSYEELSNKETARVWAHQVVRDDAHILYGFAELSERALFRQLISVSGIGAATAIVMLSSYKPQEICNGIIMEDVNFLKGIKGIGAKGAQRIIIELKDKVGAISEGETAVVGSVSNDSKIQDEAISALVMLGFARKQINAAIDKLLKENPKYSVEDLIKRALKNM